MGNTKQFFNDYSVDFNSIYATRGWFYRIIDKFFRKSMRLRFEKTIENCEPIKDKTVFDVGCGPGHYSVLLAQMGAKKVLGIDFSDKMIELANQLAKEKQVTNNCQFLVKDIYDFKDEEFDFVILMGFMDYIKEPVSLIQQIIKLTKEKAMFSFPVAEGILAWQRKLRYKKKCPLYLYTRSDLNKLFDSLPNIEVSIEKISRDYFVVISKK
ncbi:MAG TPA: class I SAM-dependent methyltransferase [Candidatus Cloacimonadota bacterium]|nr:class I SAM-dependent methyltransferase [Candidatus Cloacimonadota bacterium]HOD55225.1 class I SAM-dependent methyltransferase [Candidatus Cloacimonadota bacterium]HPM02844.1 class I SAM-dependent methyltransferase [Candidatus Cloacimonadota bacterium]